MGRLLVFSIVFHAVTTVASAGFIASAPSSGGQNPTDLIDVERRVSEIGDDTYLLNELGNLAFRLGRLDKATEFWDAASKNPNLPVAEVQLVFAELADRRPMEAEARLEDLRHERPNDPHVYIAAAQLAMMNGDLENANEAIGRANQLSRDLPAILITRGNLYELLGQVDKAIECFSMSTDLEPEFKPAWVLLGRLHFRVNNPSAAFQAFSKVKQLDDRQPLAEARLGEMFLAKGDLYSAAEYFQKSLNIAPEDRTVRTLFGSVLERAGRIDEAADQYQKVLEVAEFLPAIRALAQLEFKREKYTEAIALYRRLLAVEPDDVVARDNLAMTLILAGGSYQEAEGIVRAAFDEAPADYFPFLKNTLGCALALVGKYEEAKPVLSEAVSKFAYNQPLTRLCYAKVLLALGDRKAAETEMKACLFLDPSFSEKPELQSIEQALDQN